MTVDVYSLNGETGEYEVTATIEDGQVTAGDAEAVELLFLDEIPADEQAIIERLDGPQVVAAIRDPDS